MITKVLSYGKCFFCQFALSAQKLVHIACFLVLLPQNQFLHYHLYKYVNHNVSSGVNECNEQILLFWPRAALLETLTFFGSDIAFDEYRIYVQALPNLLDVERNGAFFIWVKDFFKHLEKIKEDMNFQEVDRQISCIVGKTLSCKENELEIITQTLNVMSKDNIGVSNLLVIICPLKCVYSTDYFVNGSKMFVMLGDFPPHSIVHEYMHLIVRPVITKHKDAILSLFGNRQYDIDQSYYLNNDEKGFLNAFEESIVRTASVLVCKEHEINIEQLIHNELTIGK